MIVLRQVEDFCDQNHRYPLEFDILSTFFFVLSHSYIETVLIPSN